MILGSKSAVERIEKGQKSDIGGICIVTSPNLDKIAKKGAASVDLRLGRWFLLAQQNRRTHYSFSKESNQNTSVASREYFSNFYSTFVLHPGRFVLAVTLEWIKLPLDICGSVCGKSSLGRRGLIIETAPIVHPGYTGCLTLELANVGEVPIELSPAMDICQLVFTRIDGAGDGESSQFSGQIRPTMGHLVS